MLFLSLLGLCILKTRVTYLRVHCETQLEKLLPMTPDLISIL